ncbi:MAG TPA: autotransporter domain-containing protein [Allosphingosinicella sp.]|nr:autotransporter domain-containing protein [Allosphingosinicella sp.]
MGTALTPAAAFAQDATWSGATAVYNTNGNWTPGTVPTNRATLAGTGQTTVAVTANASINEILFAAGAQQYMFVNDATFAVNGIGSAGITNASSFLQTITNNRSLTFNNNATVNGGTANILIQNLSNAGSNASIIFNGNSVLGATTQLLSQGASASGVGNNSLGASVNATFNNNSSADGAVLTFGGGAGGGQGGVGVAGTGIGGDHAATFSDASHADDRTIANVGGGGIGIGGGDVLSSGTGTGGNATLVFTGTSHADDSAIANSGGSGTAVGGPAGAGSGTGGAAILTFGNDSHADGTTITNTGGGAISSSGTGAAGMPGGTGAAGGAATGEGGDAILVFSGNAHINNGTIVNTTGSASASAGVGGMGDTGAGGSGGSSTSTGGSASVQIVGNNQANGTDIANGAGTGAALGGVGGAGGSTAAGIGGTGGSATANASIGATVQIAGTASIANATIGNRGGDALAAGGTGGAGGSGGAGGTGGAGTATGNAAVVIFSGTATIGAGVIINNRGGDATAAGGTGGAGGSGAAGTGGTGGAADAEGGLAFVSFNGNISAGSATIVNTAGTASISTGDGGAGNVGNGGNGGEATAQAGGATISFNNNSSAGNATITNNAGAQPHVSTGTGGAGGGGGGVGGSAAGGSLSGADASINFNDNATGGNAHIENVGGRVTFNDASIFGTAAGAAIVNRGVGFVVFNDTASLGSGAITSGGTATGAVTFLNTATAGTGTLTNLSGGSVFFRNGSSAGGATIVNQAGGQVAFSDTSLGGTATITNSGGVFFIADSDAVAARVIASAGSTTSIAGANGGTRLGSLSGAGGSVTLGANVLQVGYLNLNETFGGVISGTGQLVKRGTGTMVLTGANIYTGATTVTAGTLQIDGSITSATTVAAGGTLRGIGTITGNLVNNGSLNAGNAASPTGTLRVTGSFTSNAGSFFLVNINGTANNLLNATGALTLSGGTVRPQATPGTFFPMQFDYRIAAGASRTGTFTGIDESLLPGFVDASLFYTTTEAFLRIRRNATNFAATAGLTPNQSAASTALDAAVSGNNPLVFTTYLPLYNALLLSDAAGLRASLDIVSGDALTVTPIAAQGAAERFGDRLTTHTWSNSSNLWGLVAYGDQDGDGDGNGPGFGANGFAMQIGFATSIGPDTRFGLSAAMTNDDVDVDGRVASAEVDTRSVGAHIRHDFSMVYLAAQLTYNWHSVDTSRALLGGGAATASFDGSTWTGGAELGARFPVGPHFAVEPYLSLRHASTDQEGYAETGAAGALDVAAADYETTRAGIGLRLVNRDPASAVRPYALVGYEREMGDEVAALDNDLIGLPTFRVVSTELGQDVFTARAGIEADVGGGVSLFGDAGGRWRGNEKNVHAEAGLRIRF